MRRIAETKPVDVSKAMFMDLAFLLIAALVLLVREPAAEAPEKESSPAVELRSSAVSGIRVENIPGESLSLEIQKGGAVREVCHDGQRVVISLEQLPQRIQQMSPDGPRVIILMPDQETPYRMIGAVRDILSQLKADGTVSQILELVKEGG